MSLWVSTLVPNATLANLLKQEFEYNYVYRLEMTFMDLILGRIRKRFPEGVPVGVPKSVPNSFVCP
eukprot:scaffold353740_cov39-Attheya_sp.AAC.1